MPLVSAVAGPRQRRSARAASARRPSPSRYPWGTVIDAKYLGYDSVLVLDMCATTEPECATEFVELNCCTMGMT